MGVRARGGGEIQRHREYQTLMASVLYKYVSGRLMERPRGDKAVQPT